ncbi:MAG: hypothetical protein NT166_22455 [Candidatus Aminicenantes bacterium]|nr:hypothetical protein [Candidatus Aminicenantes bacterium]
MVCPVLFHNEMLDEMLWYIDRIPVIGYAVFEFFKSYMYEKRGMIEVEVKKILENKPDERIP